MNPRAVKPELFVHGTEKLTGIFGYWPTFHDASVIAVEVSNSGGEKHTAKAVQLVVLAHEMTDEVDEKGYFKLQKRTAVILRFHDVTEPELTRFGNNNVLFGLELEPGPNGIHVVLDSAMGGDMAGSLCCKSIEVIEARPCPAETGPWLDHFLAEHQLPDSREMS